LQKNIFFKFLYESFVATEKTRDQKHDKIATALGGAILSNAFDREEATKSE
jgi:hypothetical protein